MRTIETTVYTFDELNSEAKDRALIDQVQFIMEVDGLLTEDSAYYPAVVKMEENKTPWFLAETLFHDYRDQLIADIQANNYEFTQEGKLI